ncbi:MAG: hypothetical protein Q6K55_06365 [Thermostichus sp. DG02_3_bins_51]
MSLCQLSTIWASVESTVAIAAAATACAELTWLPTPERLTDAEILTLIQEVFLPLGIDRFRLTGGEP